MGSRARLRSLRSLALLLGLPDGMAAQESPGELYRRTVRQVLGTFEILPTSATQPPQLEGLTLVFRQAEKLPRLIRYPLKEPYPGSGCCSLENAAHQNPCAEADDPSDAENEQ